MKDYWDNTVPTGSKRNMYSGPDSGRGSWDSTQVPWDFRYSTSHALYAAGTDGKPVGALFPFGLAVAVNAPAPSPVHFALAQNFPNPFNPATTVEFSLAQRSDVSLVVYSVLGREVATLARGLHEAGLYRVTFDASDLPSGVYFCRLIAGNASQIRKMTLMK
jgi:hypothetical protein